jgi:hypothetical protein
MKKSTKAFAILVFLASVLCAFARDSTPPEAYSGVAMGTGGSVGGKSMQFDFRITQYTTDQEVRASLNSSRRKVPTLCAAHWKRKIRDA